MRAGISHPATSSENDDGGGEEWTSLVGKVMEHPARVRILQALAREGSISPSRVARAASRDLGSWPHHMHVLSGLGVVRLRETRMVRGALEHFYELTKEGESAIRAIEAVISLAPPPARRG